MTGRQDDRQDDRQRTLDKYMIDMTDRGPEVNTVYDRFFRTFRIVSVRSETVLFVSVVSI
jgi:hypothetical protein